MTNTLRWGILSTASITGAVLVARAVAPRRRLRAGAGRGSVFGLIGGGVQLGGNCRFGVGKQP